MTLIKIEMYSNSSKGLKSPDKLKANAEGILRFKKNFKVPKKQANS